jgi:hypothetical protein
MRSHGINPKTDKGNQVKISPAKHNVTKRDAYVRSVNARVAAKSGEKAIRREIGKVGNELKNNSVRDLEKKYPRR